MINLIAKIDVKDVVGAMKVDKFKIFWMVTLGLWLSSPAIADPFDALRRQENFVPFSEVLKERGDKKYFCDDFDERSQTCVTVSEPATWWFQSAHRLMFLADSARNIRLIAIERSDLDEDRNGINCSKSFIEKANVVMPATLWDRPGMAEWARNLERTITEKSQYDEVSCDAYFRAGDDFEVRSFDEKGNELPASSLKRIRFFDKKPQLRAVIDDAEERGEH